MNGDYRAVLDRSIVENVLLSLTRLQQRQLLTVLTQLEADPFVRPDYYQRGKDREYRLLFRRPFKITYWVDDPVKEIRVVDIQKL